MIVEENPDPEPESIHVIRTPSALEADRDQGSCPSHPRGHRGRDGELAANLATTDDAHIFGDNEFKIRIAPKIAAKC